ncbi:hypothetical protein [Burkholderia gladioli]|uniref:hypothetical protein n=1 Tax=Burkholderia gladioli TaxID=28095 RepID=UPI001FC85A0D|nr:hypothetical protein [Burkholderia gladioli]
MLAWLRQHAQTNGRTVDADVDGVDPPLAAPETRVALRRAPALPHILAAHNLDAVFAYLRYPARVLPVSSILVGDSEAYKVFLVSQTDAICVPPASRALSGLRLFTLTVLSLDSQRYAARTLSVASDWFVEVLYLAGNAWVARHGPEARQIAGVARPAEPVAGA